MWFKKQQQSEGPKFSIFYQNLNYKKIYILSSKYMSSVTVGVKVYNSTLHVCVTILIHMYNKSIFLLSQKLYGFFASYRQYQ